MVSNRDTQPLQTVFKVEIKQNSTTEAQPRQFVPRKAHRKSREGCYGCKKRRVKCDETKPQCGKCTKLKVQCTYSESSSPPTSLTSTMSTPQSSVTSDMYSMAMDLVETDLHSLFFEESSFLPGTMRTESGNARMLQHFQSVASVTLGCSTVQDVMHSFVGSSAWDYPFLMHMVLATSCAHQRQLDCNIGKHGRLALAEATHWERGLQLFRQHLSTLTPGNGTANWDAMMAATFLQIMLTFAIFDKLPPAGSSGDDDSLSRAIDPLAATGGFRGVMFIFGEPPLHSKWTQYLCSADDADGTFSSCQPGIDGLPRSLVDLCGLDETSTAENNPYHRIVRILTPCLHLEPSIDNFARLFACMGRVWPNLKLLLLRRDPRGLLLTAYWFALLRQIDQWWLITRARAECMAIVKYLLTLQDPAIDALLPFPAAFETTDMTQMWPILHDILDNPLPLGG